MNTWILSLIICSATPAADGSYCQARPIDVGISREACLVARDGRQPVQAGARLECTNDPALVAALRRQRPEEAHQKPAHRPQHLASDTRI